MHPSIHPSIQQFQICGCVISEYKGGKRAAGTQLTAKLGSLSLLFACVYTPTNYGYRAPAYKTINNMSAFIEISECRSGM